MRGNSNDFRPPDQYNDLNLFACKLYGSSIERILRQTNWGLRAPSGVKPPDLNQFPVWQIFGRCRTTADISLAVQFRYLPRTTALATRVLDSDWLEHRGKLINLAKETILGFYLSRNILCWKITSVLWNR